MNNFNEILKTLRKNAKMTQTSMAGVLNITHRQYQRYEGGEQFPSIEILLKISDYFNVPIDYLVGREERNRIFHGLPPTLG